MAGENPWDFLLKKRKPIESKWTAKNLGPMAVLDISVLTSIVEEHKHSVQIETKPVQAYGIFITSYDVTLYVLKGSEAKLDWILFMLERNKKVLKEAQSKTMTYVLDSKTEADPDTHPENKYEGEEPLLNWRPISATPRPQVSPQNGHGQVAGHVRLPLSTRMKLAMGDNNDPLVF